VWLEVGEEDKALFATLAREWLTGAASKRTRWELVWKELWDDKKEEDEELVRLARKLMKSSPPTDEKIIASLLEH
jgi:hypothetical protein